MIPQTQLVSFPEFSNTGTKVAPDAAKYAAGFQASDVLPAEWLNYFLNKASAGQTTGNSVTDSMQKELQNLVTQGGLTPSASVNTQVYSALKGIIQGNTKTMLCTSSVSVMPSVTGYGFITEYYDSLAVKVTFKNGCYTSAADVDLTFGVNSLGAKKVYAPKDGSLNAMKSIEWERDGETNYWFMQPYTTLEMTYDTTLDDGNGGWIVQNNPIILSDSGTSGYSIYADNTKEYSKTQVDNIFISYPKIVLAKNSQNSGTTYTCTLSDVGMYILNIWRGANWVRYIITCLGQVTTIVQDKLNGTNPCSSISANAYNLTITVASWGYVKTEMIKL